MPRAGASDFGLKIRLTSAALGCAGMKELCARFRAVNPRTHFDVERAQKWVQGRALPRFAEVYEDWAKLLQTRRSSGWLASCTVDAFLGDLHGIFGIAPEALLDRARLRAHSSAALSGRETASTHAYLSGAYACYSLAWSPYFCGQIIRGALRMEFARRQSRRFVATYSEYLLGRNAEFRGEVLIGGRTLHIDLRDAETSVPILISLALSGPPASVFCGVMSGSTLVGPDPQPSATRFVMVRVPEPPEPSNRYLQPAEGTIATDLEALGLVIPNPGEADALVRQFLLPDRSAPLMQISATEHVLLISAFDRGYLAASNCAVGGAILVQRNSP